MTTTIAPSYVHISAEGHAELDAFLADRIYEFNSDITGLRDGEALAGAIRTSTNEVVAAVTGHTWGGTCYVAHLWVQAALRGNGVGRLLMAAVESESRRRGCTQIILATHSFQAPQFYERLGYRRQASIGEYPVGHAQFHYVKHLT